MEKILSKRPSLESLVKGKQRDQSKMTRRNSLSSIPEDYKAKKVKKQKYSSLIVSPWHLLLLGVGTSLGFTSLQSSVVYFASEFGHEFFVHLNIAIYGSAVPVLIYQIFEKEDPSKSKSKPTLTGVAYSEHKFRLALSFSVMAMLQFVIPFISHSWSYILLVAVVIGSFSGDAYGLIFNLITQAKRNQQYAAVYSMGYQLSGVILFLLSVATGFINTKSTAQASQSVSPFTRHSQEQSVLYYFLFCGFIQLTAASSIILLPTSKNESVDGSLRSRESISVVSKSSAQTKSMKLEKRVSVDFTLEEESVGLVNDEKKENVECGTWNQELRRSCSNIIYHPKSVIMEDKEADLIHEESHESDGEQNRKVLFPRGRYQAEIMEKRTNQRFHLNHVVNLIKSNPDAAHCIFSLYITIFSSIVVMCFFTFVKKPPTGAGKSSNFANAAFLPSYLLYTKLFSDTLSRPFMLYFRPFLSAKSLFLAASIRFIYMPLFLIYNLTSIPDQLSISSSSHILLLLCSVSAFSFSSGVIVTRSYQISVSIGHSFQPSCKTHNRSKVKNTRLVRYMNITFKLALVSALMFTFVLEKMLIS